MELEVRLFYEVLLLRSWRNCEAQQRSSENTKKFHNKLLNRLQGEITSTILPSFDFLI